MNASLNSFVGGTVKHNFSSEFIQRGGGKKIPLVVATLYMFCPTQLHWPVCSVGFKCGYGMGLERERGVVCYIHMALISMEDRIYNLVLFYVFVMYLCPKLICYCHVPFTCSSCGACS